MRGISDESTDAKFLHARYRWWTPVSVSRGHITGKWLYRMLENRRKRAQAVSQGPLLLEFYQWEYGDACYLSTW